MSARSERLSPASYRLLWPHPGRSEPGGPAAVRAPPAASALFCPLSAMPAIWKSPGYREREKG